MLDSARWRARAAAVRAKLACYHDYLACWAWRCGGSVLILLGLGVQAVPACSSDTTHSEPCPPELVEEAACFLAANLTMAETVRSWRTQAALACATIASELGETPPEVGEEVSPEELSVVCASAQAALEAAQQADPSLAINMQDGECDVDESAEAACADDHPERAACWASCATEVLVAASCDPIVVTVTAADPSVVATLEANLPGLLATRYQAEIVTAVAGYVLDAMLELGELPAACADFVEGTRLFAEWMAGAEGVLSAGTALLSAIWT